MDTMTKNSNSSKYQVL